MYLQNVNDLSKNTTKHAFLVLQGGSVVQIKWQCRNNILNSTHAHTCIYTHTNTIAHTHFIVAPGDYKSVSVTLNTFTSQQPRQCFSVSITNDTIVELNETFTAKLTLIPASVTTITANRIIVDPLEATVQITNNDLSKLRVSSFNSRPRMYAPVRAWMADHEKHLV